MIRLDKGARGFTFETYGDYKGIYTIMGVDQNAMTVEEDLLIAIEFNSLLPDVLKRVKSKLEED